MFLSGIKKYYTLFITLGADTDTPKKALKKIKLFNGFCGVWYLLPVVMVIEDFDEASLKNRSLIVAAVMVILLAAIQFIHYKRYFYTARLLFVGTIIALTFIFSNYSYPGDLLEYYFMFAPAIGLVFIDSTRTNYLIFAVSYLCFVLPNHYFNHYPVATFNDISVSFLFFGIFILVYYFKTLNRKNESALEERTLELEEKTAELERKTEALRHKKAALEEKTEALRRKTEELENLNAFQSQFFINIAHEIRTPLTLLKGHIDALRTLSVVSPKVTDIAAGLQEQTDGIKKMVDDVLDLARMETPDFTLDIQPVNLSELVGKLYLSFEPLFQQKHIRFKAPERTVDYMVCADARYLERALSNMVINALKYTGKEGSAGITLRAEKDDIAITVWDTGIGIAEADLNKIGNRFYRADNDINKAGGTGIGLAFSREVIAQHKGSFTISSTLHKGSSFTVSLPLVKRFAVQKPVEKPGKTVPEAAVLRDITPVAKAHTILVVDDNTEMRSYLKGILKGYNCLEAEDGLEALEKLKQHKTDLILTDYMMPKMNGLQLISNLKAQQYPMPVVMLTARTDTKSRLEVLRLGIDDYLTKPFEREELLLRIRTALKNYGSRQSYIEETRLTAREIEQNSEWVQRFIRYIEQQCSDPRLTQADIAYHFNLSERSLFRKVKGETGLSPNDLIKEVKLQKARRLAENNPDILLKQLSREVGYLHYSYFSRIYRKRFGRHPVKRIS